MESSDAKLIRLAAIRGLLEPGYKYGVLSRVREILILRDLQREQSAEFYRSKALMDILTVPYLKDDAKGGIIAQASTLLYKSLLLHLLTPEKAPEMLELDIANDPAVIELEKQFLLLKQGSISDILEATLKK